MKTYREECQKLLDWATAEDRKIHEEAEASGFRGHDGPGAAKHKEVSKEYYRRLSELKKKYGTNAIPATQETDSAEPVGKARTFGQVIRPPV